MSTGNFTYPLFAARYPSVFPSSKELKNRYRSAQLAELDGQEVAKLQDPYSRSDKYRFEDAFCRDPIARRCICSYVNFLLGRRTSTTVDVQREFMNPNKQEMALRLVLNQSEIDELKTLIDRTNSKVKFHARIEAGVVQAFVGGRSALMVEREQGGMPSSLKVLTWSKLGQVFADKNSWDFLGVEYQDRDDPLLAEELIYFSNMDYNVSPDSLYYGRSMLEPVLDAIESNQYIHQEDIKEASRSLWASRGLVKFPPNIDPAQAQEFLKGFLPGTWNSTSQQVELQEAELDVKLKDLIEVSAALDKRVRTGIGTPGLLVGDENVLNYATANMVMQAWRESDLNRYRTWLQDVLEPQWFNSLVQLRFPDLNVDELLLKVKLEFDDMTLESLRDRAESLLPAVQSGYVSPEKFLQVLDMDDEIEKRAAALKQKEEQRRQQLEQMKAERDKPNPFDTTRDDAQSQKEQQKESPPVQQKGAIQMPTAIQPQPTTAKNDNELMKSFKSEILDALEQNKISLLESQRKQQEQPPVSVVQLPASLPDQTVQTLSASVIEERLNNEREIHRKQLEILNQKSELMSTLQAKIKELESTS